MGSSAYYAGMAEYMAKAASHSGKNPRVHGGSKMPKAERNRRLVQAIHAAPPPAKALPLPSRDDSWPSQNLRGPSSVPTVTSSRGVVQLPLPASYVPTNPACLPAALQTQAVQQHSLKPAPFSATSPVIPAAHLHSSAKRCASFGEPKVTCNYLKDPSDANPTIILITVVYPAAPAAAPAKHGVSQRPIVAPIRAFRDDDMVVPEQFVERSSLGEPGMRTKLEIGYSPWAMSLMEGLPTTMPVKAVEVTGGGPGGGGPRGGDGDGDGGGGSGDDEEFEPAFLLPVLTLGFALLHLAYCIIIYIKEDGFEPEFGRTGLGLFGLLAVSAIRMSCRTGIEGLVLGLCASVGVMVWSAERSYAKREMTPAGFVAVFAAVMSSIFTGALYHSV